MAHEVKYHVHPPYYGGKDGQFECIKVINELRLGFCRGNALKYMIRAGKKEGVSAKSDYDKCRHYLALCIKYSESLVTNEKKINVSEKYYVENVAEFYFPKATNLALNYMFQAFLKTLCTDETLFSSTIKSTMTVVDDIISFKSISEKES